MKNPKSITAFLLLFFPLFILAQKNPVDQVYQKYAGKDGITTIDVSGDLFNLMASFTEDIDSEDEEFNTIREVASQLDGMKLIAYAVENGKTSKSKQFYDDAMSLVPVNDFDDLMIVKEADSDIRFMIKKEGKSVKELLVLVNGGDEAVIMGITGNIDLKNLGKLSSMDIHGMKYLEEMEGNEKN